MKQGATVMLQPAAGGAPIAGRVAKVEGDTVTVELVDEAAAKPGDSLRLVKARVPNVVPVPATALVKRDGNDVVFVLADGDGARAQGHRRRQDAESELLIGSGLAERRPGRRRRGPRI